MNFGINYGIIISIAAIALSLRYLIETNAPKRAKYLVGGIVGASFVLPPYLPYGSFVALFLQLSISVFIILYLKAIMPDK